MANAMHCQLSGEALHRMVACTPGFFYVSFRDVLDRVAHAVDLEVALCASMTMKSLKSHLQRHQHPRQRYCHHLPVVCGQDRLQRLTLITQRLALITQRLAFLAQFYALVDGTLVDCQWFATTNSGAICSECTIFSGRSHQSCDPNEPLWEPQRT